MIKLIFLLEQYTKQMLSDVAIYYKQFSNVEEVTKNRWSSGTQEWPMTEGK